MQRGLDYYQISREIAARLVEKSNELEYLRQRFQISVTKPFLLMLIKSWSMRTVDIHSNSSSFYVKS